MKENINIVIPMAGAGSRFSNGGYVKPKPFIDVNGRPMILNVLENLKIKNAQYILIARKEHYLIEKDTFLEIENKYNAEIMFVNGLTEGPLMTVLKSSRTINKNNPILIANSDQIVDVNIEHFCQDLFNRKLDGLIMTFRDDHPKWSYVETNENGYALRVKEKEVISEHATVGIYLFNSGKEFVENALDMIIDQEKVNGEYYVCPVYNYFIKNNSKIGIYEITKDQMHGIGTPDDLNKYLGRK